MGQTTSIRETTLGQSVVGYTFQSLCDLTYNYYTDEQCYYLQASNYATSTNILLKPVTFTVVDIFVKKTDIGSTRLYLELIIDSCKLTMGKILAHPEDIGFTVPRKERDKTKYWLDSTNYGTTDVDQVMRCRRDMLKILD